MRSFASITQFTLPTVNTRNAQSFSFTTMRVVIFTQNEFGIDLCGTENPLKIIHCLFVYYMCYLPETRFTHACICEQDNMANDTDENYV